MKKILFLLSIFTIALVSFNANASPTHYADIGFYEVPAVMPVNAQIVSDAVTTNADCYSEINIVVTQPAQITVIVETDIGGLLLFSTLNLRDENNNIIQLQNSELLCYTTDTANNSKRIKTRHKHSRYKERLPYYALGYNLWMLC